MSFETLSVEQLRNRQGTKWRHFDDDVLCAWIADMDFPVAKPLQQCHEAALDRQEFGYPIKADTDPLAEVCAERMRQRYSWTPRADLINVMTDVVQGLYVAVDRFTQPGDGVLIQTPIYHPFLHLVRDLDRRLVSNPLMYSKQGWQLDIEHLSASIDADTRVLLFCNPHNPSGRVWTRNELEAIAELVIRHNLIVFSDEIHSDLTYPGHQHIPFASLSPELESRTITFTSASKTYNIAGVRCALAIFGSPELKQQFDVFPKRFMGGMGAGATEFTRVAWSECAEWHTQLMTYLDSNRKFIGDFISSHMPSVQYIEPQSTYLAWLDFNNTSLDEDPYTFFLREAKVALSPGPQFGDPGQGCARLNFATDQKILREILQRMSNAMS